MKNIKRAATALLLCAALLLCGCTSAFKTVAARFVGAKAPSSGAGQLINAERVRVPFDRIEYQRPDLKEGYRLIKSVRSLMREADPDALFLEYDKLLKQYEHLYTMIVFADIHCDIDLDDEFYANEIFELEKAANAFLIELDAVTADILSSPHGDAARLRWGEGFVRAVKRSAAADAESLAALSLSESAAEQTYYRESVGFAVPYKGRDWTIMDIYTDAGLSYAEYAKLYRTYCDALAKKLAPIFKELVDIRGRIARAAGEESYVDYAYMMYARDYTPNEAAAFYEAVKKYASPLYKELIFYCDARQVSALYEQSFDLEQTLERFAPIAREFSPRLEEAFSFMLDYGMCDLLPSPSKIGGGYVTLLPEYASPFLLMNWDNSYQSLTTLIHEMGHYLSYYERPVGGYNRPDPMDLAEVESQALELLFLQYYDDLFDAPDAARVNALSGALYALIAGCMEDEFQQRVYAEPDMGLYELNALYGQLAKEYGLTDIYEVPPSSWALIPHTFTSPLYYFSYAIATAPSLELFEKSLDDASAAHAMYFALGQRGQDAAFRETLEKAGLSDPFSPGLVERLCAGLKAYVSVLPSGAGEQAPAFAPRGLFALSPAV